MSFHTKMFILLLLLIAPGEAIADWHLLELEEVKATYINFFPSGRDPMITNNGFDNRELGNMLDLSLTTSILKYGYWRSLVHSMTDRYSDTHDGGQFRSVGLNMEIGVRTCKYLDVFYWHYSQHVLDTTPNNIGGFPVQDGIGINLYLYRKDNP